MKTFIKKYGHAWLILAYLPIYLIWFLLLEEHVVEDYHIIEADVDSRIPFNELIHLEKHDDKLLIVSCIDNLLKGASGTAVHNMNLLFNLKETTGLILKSSGF